VLNLLALAHLTGDAAMTQKIERTLAAFAPRLTHQGRAVPMMLAALSTYHAGMPQIVIAGDDTASDTRALTQVIRRRYLPTAVTVTVDPKHRDGLGRLLPWIVAMGPRDGRAAAYVCRDFACQAPAISPDDLARQLA
jgi:uncharacterized protein YyaL (SSP411 family)